MYRSTNRTAFARLAAVAVCATFLLTACAGGSPNASETPGVDAATERFVACLQAGGLDARTDEHDGRVLVKVPIEVDSDGRIEAQAAPPKEGGTGTGSTTMTVIEGSVYQSVDSADSFPEEYGITPVYADCEAAVPEFEQPEADMRGPADDLDPEVLAAQTELLLDFAECARENGVADFPDPADGSMVIPATVDAETLRGLLTECSAALADSEAPLSIR